MSVFTTSFLLLFAGGGGFYDRYFNIPGFEAWKFLNLAIFVGAMVYLLKKPLSEAFKAKREQIRADLIKAEEEKQAALEKLAVADAKLANLETEKQETLARAKSEAAAEQKRIADATDTETERIRKQADSELGRVATQFRAELRRLTAEKTIQLAEQKLKAQIDTTSDSRLVRAGISEIGGLN